ncbi:MAG: hypothetical protein OXG34_03420 [bacterium]|nr:hypothetical protein [bacterium]MCY4135882.1 hypothetical protein [bacterium]
MRLVEWFEQRLLAEQQVVRLPVWGQFGVTGSGQRREAQLGALLDGGEVTSRRWR